MAETQSRIDDYFNAIIKRLDKVIELLSEEQDGDGNEETDNRFIQVYGGEVVEVR